MLPSEAAWAAFIAAREDARRLLDGPPSGSNPPDPPGLLAAMAAVKASHDLLIAVERPDLAAVDYRILQEMKDVQDEHESAMFTPTERQTSGHPNWESALIATAARAIKAGLALYGHGSLDKTAQEVWPLVRAQMPQAKVKTVKGWYLEIRKPRPRMQPAAIKRYRANPADCPPGLQDAYDYWRKLLQYSPALRRPA